MRRSASDPTRRAQALAPLLIAAGLVHLWNAFATPPLAGYDAGGHAAYMLSIVEEGRLPHPLSGWSTFHPPLYYALGAALWPVLEPLGPRALGAGLRLLSAIPLWGAGWLCFALVWRRTQDRALTGTSAALVLFAPAAVLAASSLGNEALCAGFSALALPFLLRLQADPGRWRDAACAGLFAGLALSTKYTGAFVAAGCVVPFLRRGLGRDAACALAACALAGALFVVPTYARNLATTGGLLPMTRTLEPMQSLEASFVLAPRRLRDYVPPSPTALARPYLVVDGAADARRAALNPALRNVWAVVHATLWFDPFGQRIPLARQRDGVWAAPLLVGLGLVPASLMLLGLGIALRETLVSRGRAPDAPLVAMSLVALVAFVGFTWRAPAIIAAKGSYLLPLLVPAGLLFARGAARLPPRARAPVLGACIALAALAALVFTSGLVFEPADGAAAGWQAIGARLPDAYLVEAAERLSE